MLSESDGFFAGVCWKRSPSHSDAEGFLVSWNERPTATDKVWVSDERVNEFSFKLNADLH